MRFYNNLRIGIMAIYVNPGKINLLSNRIARQSLKRQRWRQFYIVNFCLIILLALVLRYVIEQKVSSQKIQLGLVKQAIQQIDRKITDLSVQQRPTYKNEQSKHAALIELFIVLPSLLPRHTFLTAVKKQQNTIILLGKAKLQREILNFLQVLTQQNQFATAKLTSIEKKQGRYEFIIEISN